MKHSSLLVWIATLLRATGSDAATTTSLSGVGTGNVVPVPQPTVEVEAAVASNKQVSTFQRRPSVDTGLRYSSSDWLVNFISTPTSFILRRIRNHVLANVIITCLVIYFYPKYPSLSIPMVGHTLLGSSLGLLLSYRTNSAYGRFWEARGHWTQTKATCRNLAATIVAHIYPHAPKSSKHFLELLSAFPLSLMHLSLGGAARLSDSVQAHIQLPQHAEEYYDAPSLPAIYLSLKLHECVHHMCTESRAPRSSLVEQVEALHLNEVTHMIDALMTHMSSCEKILRTPVPWTYSRHTSRFLTLWIGTLPFALVGTLSRGVTLAVVVAASYCMLGIEEIGHLIEQPFLGDPLSKEEQIFSVLDDEGEASALIKRGRKTQPYDIGIPVCSLAKQIRDEVDLIAKQAPKQKSWLGREE